MQFKGRHPQIICTNPCSKFPFNTSTERDNVRSLAATSHLDITRVRHGAAGVAAEIGAGAGEPKLQKKRKFKIRHKNWDLKNCQGILYYNPLKLNMERFTYVKLLSLLLLSSLLLLLLLLLLYIYISKSYISAWWQSNAANTRMLVLEYQHYLSFEVFRSEGGVKTENLGKQLNNLILNLCFRD